MKMLAIGTALVTCLALSACAGTAGNSSLVRHQGIGDDIDYGKVLAVNQWASGRGATVVWINYPQRGPHTKPSAG